MNNSLTEALLQHDNKQEGSEDIQLLIPPSQQRQDDDVEVENNDQQQQLILNQVEETWNKGETQPLQYRDVLWAILFIIHVLIVIVIAIVWGIPSLNYNPYKNSNDTFSTQVVDEYGNVGDDDDNNNNDYTLHFDGVIYMCLLGGLTSIIISSLMLSIMIRYSKFLVQMSVLFSTVVSLVFVVLFACVQMNVAGIVMSSIMFIGSSCYAYAIWHRIPFAACNLKVSTNAIKTNIGIMCIPAILIVISLLWTLCWWLAVLGVYVQTSKCDADTGECESNMNSFVVILFLISYYWTSQVIKNVIHVTVAGVVGTWWFTPAEASSMYSKAITDSFTRSMTTSFGSICLGSLLVALLNTLHQIIRNARQRQDRAGAGDGGILLCLAECIVSFLESILEYFNKFAYIYVGLYGYTYMDAGKNVMTLFKQRGWTTIINDNLISNVLSLMIVITSFVNGIIGISIAAALPSLLAVFGNDMANNSIFGIAFFISFLIAFVVTSILMSVISSAVDTIVVCFCEAPNELISNHPLVYTKMFQAWQLVYPDELSSRTLHS